MSTTNKSSKSRTLHRNGQEGNAPPGDFDTSEPPQQISRAMTSMGQDNSREGLAAGSSEAAVGSHPSVAAPFASLGGSSSQPPPASHAFDNLDSVDLPQYVKAHITTLTFPEKVRTKKHPSTLCMRLYPYDMFSLTFASCRCSIFCPPR